MIVLASLTWCCQSQRFKAAQGTFDICLGPASFTLSDQTRPKAKCESREHSRKVRTKYESERSNHPTEWSQYENWQHNTFCILLHTVLSGARATTLVSPSGRIPSTLGNYDKVTRWFEFRSCHGRDYTKLPTNPSLSLLDVALIEKFNETSVEVEFTVPTTVSGIALKFSSK